MLAVLPAWATEVGEAGVPAVLAVHHLVRLARARGLVAAACSPTMLMGHGTAIGCFRNPRT